MYSKIIAGYDGRPSSEDALALARAIARITGGEVTAAGVFLADPFWGGPDPSFQELEAESREQIESAAKAAGADPVTRPSSSTARGLHDLAEESGADLIVVGSASSGKVGQVLAGNVALSLLHGSPCAVAVAPKGYAKESSHAFEEAIVGYDGSPESRAAVHDAVAFARSANASLKVVAVVEPPPISYGKGANQGRPELMHDIEKIMRSKLDDLLAELPDDIKVDGVLATGDPAKALADVAVEDGGVLFAGSRGYGPLRRVLLGSVSRELMSSAPCAVIVHPRSAEARAPAMAAAAQAENAR